jgi:hypothetical protein
MARPRELVGIAKAHSAECEAALDLASHEKLGAVNGIIPQALGRVAPNEPLLNVLRKEREWDVVIYKRVDKVYIPALGSLNPEGGK